MFLPLVSITGVTGTFFRALAITVGMALLTSLALALTWTPALSHYLIRRHTGKVVGVSEKRLSHWTFLERAVRVYEHALRLVLSRPLILVALSLGLITGSYLCYHTLGSDLLPSMDEGGFILDYIMPGGSSLAETNRVISRVEEVLRSIPEVASTSRRTGLQLGLAQVTEANTGDVSVKLKHERRRSVDEVIAEVRGRLATELPVLQIEFVQLLQDMIGDLTSAPEPIEIKLFSQNPALLTTWAPKVGEELKKIHGVVDVLNGIDNTISGPTLTFKVNPLVAARAGFTPEEIEIDASAIIQGEPAAAPVVLNDRPYTVRVRYAETARASVDAIQNALLISSNGKTATLGSLADVIELPGQTEIRRENLQRDVAVTARLEGLNLGSRAWWR